MFNQQESTVKRALLLCASHNDLGLIKALRKLGYFIIATGNNPDVPGIDKVDKWICEDYSDREAILKIALEEKIDAVCQCCNDFGVYTAAYVAEKMGLSGYDSYETTLILHNKDKFKIFAKKNGILTPVAESFSELEDAMNYGNLCELPLIIKPVDASAGRGISTVRKKNELKEALKYAFDYSKKGKVVIEEFIEGKQYGFCTFLINKKVAAIASNNEYSYINPYRVEIDTFPADNFDSCRDFLVEEIEKIADLLQLKDGIFHLQYIYHNGKPWIIEVMRRVLGNMYSVASNELNGFDWDYWETRAKCGLKCDNFPRKMYQEGFFAYKSIMADRNGIIESIDIPHKLRKYIYYEYWLSNVGDKIWNYLSQPIGFLFMMFPDSDEMKKILIDEYSCNIVKIKEKGMTCG